MWLCTFGNNQFLPIKGGLYAQNQDKDFELVSVCFYQNDKNKSLINDLIKNGRTLSVKSVSKEAALPGLTPASYSDPFSIKIGANELTHLKNASQKLTIVEGSYEWFVNINKLPSIITLKDVKRDMYLAEPDVQDKDFLDKLKAGVKKILIEQYPYPLKEEFMEELLTLLTDFKNGLGKKCCHQLIRFQDDDEVCEERNTKILKEVHYLFSLEEEVALKAIPLAYGMSRFKQKFTRIPQIREVSMMINPERFNVKTFQEFISIVTGSKDTFLERFDHEARIRLTYVYEIFSNKISDISTLLLSNGINILELDLKEAAIALSKSSKNYQLDLVIKGLRSVVNYFKEKDNARLLLAGILAYLSNFSKIDNLVEIAGKPSELISAIQTSSYECIAGAEEMANACGRLLMPQSQFDAYQKLYVESAKKALRAARSIPTVSGEIENTRYSWAFVTAEDVRAYLAGLETNCCQHLFGMGSSCVRFMANNPDKSGIFLVLKDNQTVAQSFVWFEQKSGTVCFDNIEALGGSIRENVWKCYESFADVLEKYAPMFGYKKLTIGTGYSDVSLEHLEDCYPLYTLSDIEGGENIYSDANSEQKVFRYF